MSEYYRDDEFREGHHRHHHHRREGDEGVVIIEEPQGGGGMYPGGGYQPPMGGGGQFGYQDPNFQGGGGMYYQGGNYPQIDEYGRREFPGGNYPGNPGSYPGNYNQGPQGYVDPYGGGFQNSGSRREFFIISEMNEKVVDIQGQNVNAGAHVITYHRQPEQKNQLWFINAEGFIVSALNGMSFGSEGKGKDLKMMPLGDPHTLWRYEPPQIVNNSGECLDIKGAHSHDGANLCAYEYKDQKNQHWRIEYIN